MQTHAVTHTSVSASRCVLADELHRTQLCSWAVGVGVGMSGCRAKRTKNRECVRSVRVRIGTCQNRHEKQIRPNVEQCGKPEIVDGCAKLCYNEHRLVESRGVEPL